MARSTGDACTPWRVDGAIHDDHVDLVMTGGGTIHDAGRAADDLLERVRAARSAPAGVPHQRPRHGARPPRRHPHRVADRRGEPLDRVRRPPRGLVGTGRDRRHAVPAGYRLTTGRHRRGLPDDGRGVGGRAARTTRASTTITSARSSPRAAWCSQSCDDWRSARLDSV